MSNIYVPIDYTDAKKVIPEGEDIIYSTLCKVNYTVRSGNQSKTYFFDSHVLFTEEGFAYTIPQKSDEILLLYRPLNQIYKLRKNAWQLKVGIGEKRSLMYIYGKEKFIYYNFKCKRAKEFESKEKFKERSSKFEEKLMPLILKSKRDFLDSPDSSKLTPKEKKNLIKSIEKMEKGKIMYL
jgi:hypothetical protein